MCRLVQPCRDHAYSLMIQDYCEYAYARVIQACWVHADLRMIQACWARPDQSQAKPNQAGLIGRPWPLLPTPLRFECLMIGVLLKVLHVECCRCL